MTGTNRRNSTETLTIGGIEYRRRPRYATGWERRSGTGEWTWYGTDIDALCERIAELEAELDHALDLLGTSRGPADSVAEIARSDWYKKVFVLWRKHREGDDG